MRRKNLFLSLTFCLPFALASCGGGEANRNGAAVTAVPSPAAPGPAATPRPVTATVEEATLDAGLGAGEARVRLDIAQGFHTHANPATDKFYIPTTLTAEPSDGIMPGMPVYPPGVERKLGFAEKPLSLYEGSVVIKLPLRAVSKEAGKGRHTLRAKLRVQYCNDTECFPPQTIDAPIPVTVN
jgi:hypothetical protein